jgi:hypothetical protein
MSAVEVEADEAGCSATSESDPEAEVAAALLRADPMPRSMVIGVGVIFGPEADV